MSHTTAGRQAWCGLGRRLAIGSLAMLMVLAVMFALGRSFALGFQLWPVCGAFLFGFVIIHQPVILGYGGIRTRIIASYFFALCAMAISVYVLWQATDPALFVH